MTPYLNAAIRLHQYTTAKHWQNNALIGPDPGIRFNYRIGRFIKSYLSRFSWNDDYYYVQGQGYWALGNWELFKRTGRETYRDIALRCSEAMLKQQRDDGAWEYPNVEWKGRIATAEGVWGSLGLLETYRQTGEAQFLEGAVQWHKFMTTAIGYQKFGDELAVNYFANDTSERVPNNSAFLLRFLAELNELTGEKIYCQPCTGLLTFMQRAQKTNGEFPYSVVGHTGGRGWPHFQCYQYNAFQCLDLMKYYQITGSADALPIIRNVLNFLQGGLTQAGYACYECGNRHRTVTYHTAVMGAAFTQASQLGLGNYNDLADRAYAYVLRLQRPNGSFPYSQRDYYLFQDRRSYPRYLAMILYHLLLKDAALEHTTGREEATRAPAR